MRLVNHLNEVLEIRVNKYEYENSVNVYFDSDALNITILIEKEEVRIKRALKFMDVEQIELMEEWLILVSTTAGNIKTLYFIDVDLEFRKFTRGNIPYMKVLLNDHYNEWTKKQIAWDIILSKKNVHLMTEELQKILEVFPCRCGMPHDCFEL